MAVGHCVGKGANGHCGDSDYSATSYTSGGPTDPCKCVVVSEGRLIGELALMDK